MTRRPNDRQTDSFVEVILTVVTRRPILIAALLAGLTAPAWAGFDEGAEAYNRGDYETALRELRPLAVQGQAASQVILGLMYASGGKGVPQDYAEAVAWFRKAAEQGIAFAQFMLGGAYANGQGVPQDYGTAVKWFRKAAEQGDAEAQSMLGVAYANGQGVPQDYAKALKWYREAAEQGNGEAQNDLGVMYVRGLGVPQDYVQAHMWFNLAASRLAPGDKRDKAVKHRDSVASRMTAAQVAEAQRRAREWKQKSE